MTDDASNHECNHPKAMTFAPKTPHDRRPSTFTGVTGANALAPARTEQQSALTSQNNGSQDDGDSSSSSSSGGGSVDSQTEGLPYMPTSAPTSSMSSAVTLSLPSPSHTVDDIETMILKRIRLMLDDDAVDCYLNADVKPPITQESLAELDMPRIINNPKLRHDVNFDRELHFRPNLDGNKGKQKVEQAVQYWKALEVELVLYNYVRAQAMEASADEADWSRVMKQSLRRLEGVFSAIREIMTTLVPEDDQQAVRERLDVAHVMQQIQNGVCDLIDLAKWLAKVLQSHCAPMRDALVDAMRKEIECGVHANAPARLVEGLRRLMIILEAMKLDVANHQIRHMRPLLIDDTINFQQCYNKHRIKQGKILPHISQAWLHAELQQPTFYESGPISPLDAYCSALLRDVVFNDESDICPQAFYLDADRLQALRLELHAAIYHHLCRQVFHDLARSSIDPLLLASMYTTLYASISAIVGPRGNFGEHSEHIAVEIVRTLLAVEGRSSRFDEALQEEAEYKLQERLHPRSEGFKRIATLICERIIPKLRARVHSLIKMKANALHNELVPGPPPRSSALFGFGAVCEPAPTVPLLPADPDDDLVRRVTHMLVLHWQVWSDLVYLADDPASSLADEASSDPDGHASAATSAVASPTVPIAHAVYAPGSKRLLVKVTVSDVPNLPNPLPTPSPSPSLESQSSTTSGDDEQSGEEASGSDVGSE